MRSNSNKLKSLKTVTMTGKMQQVFKGLFNQKSFIEEQEENDSNNQNLENIAESQHENFGSVIDVTSGKSGTNIDGLKSDVLSGSGTFEKEQTVEYVSPNIVKEQDLNEISPGIHSTKVLRSEFIKLDVIKNVSALVQKYLMESHNS